MNIEIRPYERRDFDQVRLICIATDNRPARSETRRTFVLKTYCDYYIETEPRNCFVAVDLDADPGGGKVAGYILCAEDYEDYAKNFAKNYLPKIKETGWMNSVMVRAEVRVFGRHAAFFPAHMHIDILPAYQRQGVGGRLVDTLVAHLKAKKIKGVMLIVGSKNIKGCSFYRKYGFSEIGKIGSGIEFGLDL
ncbi:MAG: GNAT family N-acetyltransferase [Oscillospiraceae bacterium]|nr:GNAT family N-acetyltransferase [Oscillospiraceae bacterium]